MGLDENSTIARVHNSEYFTKLCVLPFSGSHAFLSKIFTKDPLMLSGEYGTYFIDINREMDKKSFEKTW